MRRIADVTHQRSVELLLLFSIGCAHRDPPPAAPPRRPEVAKPLPLVPSVPTPRLDRPATRLGGPATWATADSVGALRFCPGDEELVTAESSGGVRRYRVGDGAQLAVTVLDGVNAQTRWDTGVDCRADGAALALDGQHSPVLIDRAGKVTPPPAPIEADRAQFAADGSVWALGREGVIAWRGETIAKVIPAREHVLYEGLAEGGVYVDLVYNSGKPADDGMWMTRDGVRIKLPGRSSDITMVSVAPDGGLVVADEMAAYGWTMKGVVAGPKMLLLDQSGTHVSAIAATNRWFIAVDAGGNVWNATRPAMRWDHIDKPCGEGNYLSSIAVAHDDKRIALACTGVGIRIYDLETARQLSKDAPNSAADTLAWSPDGHRLATRSTDGAIRIWRGELLVTTIPDTHGRGLWWDSPSAIGGESYGDVVEWSVPEGKQHPDTLKLSAEATARSSHGEVIAASRVMSGTIDRVTIVRGDRRETFDLPDTKHDWIDGLEINDAGARAVLWRGQYNGKPGTEVIAIDVASHAIQLDPGTVTAAAIDDATIVTAGFGGELVRRDGGTSKRFGDHGGEVTALAIRADLVAAGGADGAISLWSLTGTALGTLRGHTAAIRSLALSPDGSHLASTGADGTLVWDLSP